MSNRLSIFLQEEAAHFEELEAQVDPQYKRLYWRDDRVQRRFKPKTTKSK